MQESGLQYFPSFLPKFQSLSSMPKIEAPRELPYAGALHCTNSRSLVPILLEMKQSFKRRSKNGLFRLSTQTPKIPKGDGTETTIPGSSESGSPNRKKVTCSQACSSGLLLSCLISGGYSGSISHSFAVQRWIISWGSLPSRRLSPWVVHSVVLSISYQ